MSITHKTKGFTLIELLVVIAMIAILLAILMPALWRVKAQTSGVVCKSNLHQWGVIWHMYAQKNEGKFPVAILTWRDLAKDYHKDKNQKITLCPRAKKLYTDGACAPFAAWEKTWDGGDASDWGRPFASSHGVNQYLCNKTSVSGGRDLDEIWGTVNVKNANQFEIPLWRVVCGPVTTCMMKRTMGILPRGLTTKYNGRRKLKDYRAPEIIW